MVGNRKVKESRVMKSILTCVKWTQLMDVSFSLCIFYRILFWKKVSISGHIQRLVLVYSARMKDVFNPQTLNLKTCFKSPKCACFASVQSQRLCSPVSLIWWASCLWNLPPHQLSHWLSFESVSHTSLGEWWVAISSLSSRYRLAHVASLSLCSENG